MIIADTYNVTNEAHLKGLKAIIDKYASKKIMSQHFYTYNRNDLHTARVNLMFEETKAIDDELIKLDLKS
ncbi:MAG: hypothetical protein AAF942_01600, partial [Pseudomonadota bacterium]